MGYIYKITNKINNKVYIGKTEGDIGLRWQQHIYNASLGIQYHLYNAMRKYGVNNFIFEIIEENILSSNELLKKEKEYIKLYNSCENGYNMTLGGEGVTKYSHEEIKNKYLELNSIVDTAKYFNCNENTVRRILKEYNIYTNFNNQDFARPVKQFALTEDILLNQFNSLSEAAKFLNKNNTAAIRQACKGEISQAYGYRWKYADDNTSLQKAKKVVKRVMQLDKDTKNIIKIFNSVKEAAEAIKCDASSIHKVCNGKRKTCAGFCWQYCDENNILDFN